MNDAAVIVDPPTISAPPAIVAGLEPLLCSGCGAALPLGHGPRAVCPYCRAETPIPETHGALQRAVVGFAYDKHVARQLYGRIGEPPGWFARNWGRGAEGSVNLGALVSSVMIALLFGHPLVGLGVMLAAAYVLGVPVAWLMRVVASSVGHPIQGELSPYLLLPISGILIIAILIFPAILFRRERTLSGVRREIHASLAAAFPERPGGPSRCRSCGAALDVPSGALGVPCVYCKADNLVALPKAWVDQVRSGEFRLFLRIDSALDAFHEANEAAREDMWGTVFAFVALLPVLVGLAWLLEAAKISF